MKTITRVFFLVCLLACAAAFLDAQGAYTGLGAESVPPEKVAKYAPPPLPAEVSRRIQTMLDVRSPGLGRVSQDGSRLFFTWKVTGSTQVWRLDGPKSYPVQMTGGEESTFVVETAPDGKSLLLSRDVGGQENPGLYVQPAGGGPLRTIQKIDKVQRPGWPRCDCAFATERQPVFLSRPAVACRRGRRPDAGAAKLAGFSNWHTTPAGTTGRLEVSAPGL